MHTKTRPHDLLFDNLVSSASAANAITTTVMFLVVVFVSLMAQLAQGQTYQVTHNFTAGGDGAEPFAGLTSDASGNLYGTTWEAAGSVFELKHSRSNWILTPIYTFNGSNDGDGIGPYGGVTVLRNGTLYGTTLEGGLSGCGSGGCGTVFHLSPTGTYPPSALAPWDETVLYRFTGGNDGANPQGDLVLDSSGNIYGTTHYGGNNYRGVIYELVPSKGGWTEAVLYSPQSDSDGVEPWGGVVFDAGGNLYGTFSGGGPYSAGVVYRLSPSGSNWIEETVYAFTGGSDGGSPIGGLIIDSSGTLYGTTAGEGSNGGGTVFKLSPDSGGWTFTTLCAFSGQSGSWAKLALDAAGNLYGTTLVDGPYGWGTVFEAKSTSRGWTCTSLHDFTGGNDGGYPVSSVIFDASGNLYGTTKFGGAYGFGVTFEITP